MRRNKNGHKKEIIRYGRKAVAIGLLLLVHIVIDRALSREIGPALEF